jgi:hypothetical protein
MMECLTSFSFPGTSLYRWLRPSTQLSSPSLYCRGVHAAAQDTGSADYGACVMGTGGYLMHLT